MATALFTQPFSPNIRTITGLNNLVYQDDYVLNCDTTLGAISIELPTIPTNFWSTQYKLLIVDSGNNSAVNNITINAPSGFKINGQSSITISVNGASFFIAVGNNVNYLGLYGGVISGGSTTGIISLSNAQLLTLVNTSNIIGGQFYFVNDVSNVNFAAGEGVVVQGIKVDTATTVAGAGYFLNADYQGVGVYSGTPIPYLNNLGIWFQGTAPVGTNIGSVAIYNNLHYINLTGTWWNTNPASNPSNDNTNWAVLPKTTANVGYIRVVDDIKYDINLNQVTYRADKLGNEVDFYVTGLINSLTYFQWGRNDVTKNKLRGSSYFSCQNSFCTFTGNTLDNSYLIDATASATGSFVGNSLSNDSFINSTNNLGSVLGNKLFNNGGLVIENSTGTPVFSYNEISDLTATLKSMAGTTSRKKAGAGFSNFFGTLDCANPLVYKINGFGRKTLVINAVPPYDTHIGIFRIDNLNDDIEAIENLSTIFPTTFTMSTTPPFESNPFESQSISSPPNQDDIVSSAGAFSFLITGRVDGTDTIQIIRSNKFNQIVLANIMA